MEPHLVKIEDKIQLANILESPVQGFYKHLKDEIVQG
jgi:hypothetical protein